MRFLVKYDTLARDHTMKLDFFTVRGQTSLDSRDTLILTLKQRGDGEGGYVSGISAARSGAMLFATEEGSISHICEQVTRLAAPALLAEIARAHHCMIERFVESENQLSALLLWTGNEPGRP